MVYMGHESRVNCAANRNELDADFLLGLGVLCVHERLKMAASSLMSPWSPPVSGGEEGMGCGLFSAAHARVREGREMGFGARLGPSFFFWFFSFSNFSENLCNFCFIK